MPVARPQYGRKPGPSVLPPAPLSKKEAKAKAQKAAADAAVAVAITTIFTSVG